MTWAALCTVLMLLDLQSALECSPRSCATCSFPGAGLLCLGVPFTLLIVLGVRRWPVRSRDLSCDCMRARVLLASLPAALVGQLRRPARNAGQYGHGHGIRRHGRIHAAWRPILPPSTKDARRVTVEGPAHAAIRVSEWDAEHKAFTAEMSAPDQLSVASVQLSGVASGSERTSGADRQREGTGQMLVPVEAGENRVQITFVRTWDRTAGAWISDTCDQFCLSLKVFHGIIVAPLLPRAGDT